MSKLFIYYSFTGSGDQVSKEFEKAGFEIRKVVEKKKMPKSFFFSIMVGGFRASVGAKGKLVNYDNDVSKYDKIVIGSSIWNARLTPAINSVLKETNFEGKDLSFVLYSGSGTAKKAEEKIKKEFPSAKIIFLKEPKKYPEELKKLEKLAC